MKNRGILSLLLCGLALALPSAIFAGEIDCSTRGNSLGGTPGTGLVVTCPAGCTSGPVWGSAIYTDDSAICSAAIHAGYLTAKGGRVGIMIKGAQPGFAPSTRHGITSSQYGAWTKSFSFTRPRDATSADSGSSSSPWGQAAIYWAIIAVVVILFVLLWRSRKRQREDMAGVLVALAKKHNLEFKRPKSGEVGELTGSYQGYDVKLRSYTHSAGSGNAASTYLEAETKLSRPLLDGMRIFPRMMGTSILTAVDKLGGEKEILTGNSEFDKTIYVGSQDESKSSLFTPAVQSALLKYFEQAGGWDLFLSGASIKATRGITKQSGGQLEAILNLQSAVAAAFG